MQVKWVVESGLEDTERIERHRQVWLKATYHKSSMLFPGVVSSHPTVAFGSIPFCHQFNKNTSCIPGAFYDKKQYECAHYYPHFNPWLLNREYVMLPVGDLLNQLPCIHTMCGMKVFIRPNAGNKVFTGFVCNTLELRHKIAELLSGGVKKDEIVLVSKEKTIAWEARFWVRDRRIITGSFYLPNEDHLGSLDSETYKFVQDVVENTTYENNFYVLDIALATNKPQKDAGHHLYVLEVNAVSTSGLYMCNELHVIEAIEAEAVKRWSEYYDVDELPGL